MFRPYLVFFFGKVIVFHSESFMGVVEEVFGVLVIMEGMEFSGGVSENWQFQPACPNLPHFV